MRTPLTLTPGRGAAGTPVLTAAGEIDMSNSADLAAAIQAALDDASGPLVVDLTRVEYLDSAGLSVLHACAERVEILVSPLLAPLLDIAGLTERTTVHHVAPPAPGGLLRAGEGDSRDGA